MSRKGSDVRRVSIDASTAENAAVAVLYGMTLSGYAAVMNNVLGAREAFENKLLEGQEGLLDEAGTLNYGKTPAKFYITLGAFAGPPVLVYGAKTLWNIGKGLYEGACDLGPVVAEGLRRLRSTSSQHGEAPGDVQMQDRSDETLPLTAPQGVNSMQIQPKVYRDGWAGRERWQDFGLNIISLHVPKAVALATTLMMLIESGSFTVPLDIWERTKEEDFEKAAALALKAGKEWSDINPTVAAFSALVVLIIVREQYARVELPQASSQTAATGRLSKIFRAVNEIASHAFVDHTQEVAIPRPAILS